jgi:uncharacterized protein YggE
MAFQLPALTKNKLHVTLDLRIAILVLLAVIMTMLLIWKPWSGTAISDRTVEVNGEATITAKPDKFVFYPSYEFKNADKTAALTDISKKSAELTAKLKALGVSESDIKTTSSGYDYPIYKEPNTDDSTTYSLQLMVTADNLETAQKVQDYLITTSPLGSVSPQASFSEAKRKQLESQARDKATTDARTKVDQMAKNVGFKVGAVKKISEDQGFSIMPMDARSGATSLQVDSPDSNASKSSLGVQPGENELPYTITVTYYIR